MGPVPGGGRHRTSYSSSSWDEHMRLHSHRLTGVDRQYEKEAQALSDPPEGTSHLIAAVEIPDYDI